MKDFKDFMKLKVDGIAYTNAINSMVKKAIIIDGLKNFYNYAKCNPSDIIFESNGEDYYILKIDNARCLKLKKKTFEVSIWESYLSDNILVLEQQIIKLKKTLSFLDFIEKTMVDSEI